MTIRHGEGRGVGIYYKEEAKKRQMIPKLLTRAEFVVGGVVNIGQPPFRQ